jgi:putative endonuclease
MAYYVYIIESPSDGSFYKGFSENPIIRLEQHNDGQTSSTRLLVPWKLIYVEELNSKRDALIREKNLKKATRERILALCCRPFFCHTVHFGDNSNLA